ncbi:MFS transporter [Streptomyces sp. NPDC048514]|uniref:MFS transporter n=1 Tax=Streptomyces sp. NPDC048514 TaxID=3365564 RepID=UPI00370FB9A4
MSGVPRHVDGEPAPSPVSAPPRQEAGAGKGGRRDTAVLWWVNAVDALGSQASGLVFPLLLLDLGHGPATAGAFASAAAIAGVLLGPLIAVPADRGHRRALMTASAVLAALAMAGLAVSCLRHPPLWVLLGLALTERLSATAYEAAARGALSRLAAPDDMPRAVAGLQAGDQAALVLGPALGGVLFGVSRFLPFAVDAVTYAVAALGTRAIRGRLDPHTAPAQPTGGTAEPPPGTTRTPPTINATRAIDTTGTIDTTGMTGTTGTTGVPGRIGGELGAGVEVVLRSPVLRLVLLWSSVASGMLALLFYTALFVLGGRSGGAVTGGVLTVSGAAGLAGSLVAARVVRRLGAHRSLAAATWLLLPPCAALSVAEGPWVWALCFSTLCAVLPVVTVVLGAAAVLAAPQELQSRAGAVLAAGATTTAALAPVCAAALVGWGGGRLPALCCGAVLAVLAVHTQRSAATVPGPPGPADGPGRTGPSTRSAAGDRP